MNAVLKSGMNVGAFLLLAMPSLVLAVDVSDAGHFFSPAALEKANTAIRGIEKKSGHEIRIETHATVPADQVEAVAKMDRDDKQKFMGNWIKTRAAEVKENGTLILICKEPSQAKTLFNKKLKDAGLTQADTNQISEVLVAGLKAKDNDKALNDVVAKLDSVYAKLTVAPGRLPKAGSTALRPIPVAANRPRAAAPEMAGWSSFIGIGLAVLFGIFVISMLSRLFSGGGGNRGFGGGGGYGGQPGFGGGGGGGGFMSGLAGGLFGAVAGNWLYNSFGGHSAHAQDGFSSGHQSGLADDNTSTDAGWTDEGSMSGGGWYDDGDSGGDSSGGGDFGGGDSGGDFSGGGDF
jgi:uncharacterized protein